MPQNYTLQNLKIFLTEKKESTVIFLLKFLKKKQKITEIKISCSRNSLP